MLFSFEAVNFGYDGNLILSDVNFAINEGERVGLVGENGAGKTTLIRLLAGELFCDSGKIIKKNGARIGYLEQNGGYDSENTVYAEMLAVFGEELAALKRADALSAELATCEYGGAEYKRLSAKLEALHRYVASRDCYNIEVRIKTVLGGMGFEEFYERKISDMSGGEKTRLKLCRLLLESPDLLVLDEPTNHLDIKTLYWLEGYLSTFKGAVFVVSHDRYFLDKIISSTAEIENKKLILYRGNYTKYKTLKTERYERQLKEYERQREEIERLQIYVDKNIVRATTAKSAQSRVKQLERMELLEKPFTPPKPPRFKFEYLERPSEDVLTIKDMTLCAGGKTLIDKIDFTLKRGVKLAIVGDNGTGKSTFLKSVVSGAEGVTLGRYAKIAYYEQEMTNLSPENTVLNELWGRHHLGSQTQIRASLARCGLFPEDMDKKVKELSGGERAKLALCVFENQCGNLLVLDEPTNHLDLSARESLEKSLKEFDGTVIFVSHDRYFIAAVADVIAELQDGKFTLYEGGFDGYLRQKELIAQAAERDEKAKEREKFLERRQNSYRSKEERAEKARLDAERKRIEAAIAEKEKREEELNRMIADPQTASDYFRLSPLLKELEQTRTEIEGLYEVYGSLI